MGDHSGLHMSKDFQRALLSSMLDQAGTCGSSLNSSDTESDSDRKPGVAGDGDTKATSEVSSAPIDPKEYGMSLGYKQLYSGKEDRHGRYVWVCELPKDIGEPAENAESEKWAIILRHNQADCAALDRHSELKDVLGDVLADYPGVALELKRLEFDGRFEPLVHCWPALREAIAKLEHSAEQADADTELKTRLEHAKLLDNIMIKEFSEIAETMVDLKGNGVITYDHLWTIFEPGALVHSSIDNQDRAFRLHSSRYGKDAQGSPVFSLSCVFVDFDGQRFETQKHSLRIESFEGHRQTQNLRVFPIDFHDGEEEIKSKLKARGDKFEALAGTHYCNYNGVGWTPGQQPGTRDKFNVTGRIVIDGHGYNRYKPNHGIYLAALNAQIAQNVVRGATADANRRFGIPAYATFDFSDTGGMPCDGFFESEPSEGERQALTEDQKIIATPFVRGYSLRLKEWLNFFANSVSEIVFNEDAFASLELPDNQKELILGFTLANQVQRNRFDDAIAGKGRGTILLLSGPPGVGKTLTAESVAEKMRVPLFAMAAGDLGLGPKDVETELQNILDMCARWGAVALLDEADVFLEARNNHELERNKLVSIFLRVLEYYEGIMFLTSNRTSSFDRAFESRIHISLQYKDLEAKARKAIWQTFLDKHNAAQAVAREQPAARPLAGAAKLYAAQSTTAASSKALDAQKEEEKQQGEDLQPHKISAGDLKKLASLPINGRQIKNFLKMAQLLAAHRKEALAYGHVEDVVEATQHLHKATQASDEAVSNVYS
ncbi:Putative AAA+ ATPase domain, ATPase, AAA-type, core [Septoria linicola]|uniref:AAA+ ATPase domain, ATPase, AAA-type, core n=1 Tax=Septoria linicola TaxID=215465 RepID=A0A9Q9AGD6_9PEZI|nr:putative AAA+ ATPase domain, ATPase, AAA-type, core [Septoria linicola]USW48934.1 Putative AAA+ ATPase domain, ATPase, AAA-type, core [Septoria linicola]